MLYLIGAGLYDEQDLTLRGLKILQSCSVVYLESYTSLQASHADLEKVIGKPVIVADRLLIEQKADSILSAAKDSDVAVVIIGDVFGATTHTDLYMRAHAAGVPVKVVHNASVLTAVGEVGLELYKYGKTTSMVFFEDKYKPATPYHVIAENRARGAHTLVLLDIKADEQRYMTVGQCLDQLLLLERELGLGVITDDLLVVGCARLGAPDRKIVAGPLRDVIHVDFGAPLHCLLIPGNLHFVEEEVLALWKR